MIVKRDRIEGTEAEIDALIMAAKVLGLWSRVENVPEYRVMMRAIVRDVGFGGVRSLNAWPELINLATKMGGTDGA